MVDISALVDVSRPFARWLRNTGMAMAARMPMMIMTTRSSMRVKPSSRLSRDLRNRARMLFSFAATMPGAPGPVIWRMTRRLACRQFIDRTSRLPSDSSTWVTGQPEHRQPRINDARHQSRALLDQVEDLEDRHVERDDHRADDAAQKRDHQRLDQRGQRLGRGLNLLVVELGNLAEHGVKSAGVLTDRHHLHDHGREDLVVLQRLAQRLAVAHAV